MFQEQALQGIFKAVSIEQAGKLKNHRHIVARLRILELLDQIQPFLRRRNRISILLWSRRNFLKHFHTAAIDQSGHVA
ncbi:hypothetical protein D3C77_275260 [compost metagenome]